MLPLSTHTTWPSLSESCAVASTRARTSGTSVVLSFTIISEFCNPLALFAQLSRLGDSRLFWSNPGAQLTYVGVGTTWSELASGPHRFAQTAASWRNLATQALVVNACDCPSGHSLVLLGGFAFHASDSGSEVWKSFPDGMLILPELLATFADGRMWLTVNHICNPDENQETTTLHMEQLLRSAVEIANTVPAEAISADQRNHEQSQATLNVVALAPEAWKQSVQQSAARVRTGYLEKVVLARTVRAQAPERINPAALLAYLRPAYPNCYLFAFERGLDCFLGATPEQLVHANQGFIHTMCLAGSTARGVTPKEDTQLGQALLGSHKDRGEHEIVVRAIVNSLANVCVDINVPSKPGLLRLPNVQHLHTPVTARLASGQSIFDVVEQLHPTPAVGGYPKETAYAEILRREPVERGWYAGPVGWVDSNGGGEFAVAIRSALLSGSTATLYAGCGIVADSDPDSEYDESCLKLRPMLAALEASLH